ncbi:MAG: GAF domain-containing protein, partial [Ramlibacter sp.]
GGAAPLRVRRVAADHSVFLDGDYLIRGVAGAIFWKLACAHVEQGRCDFTNRELRSAPDLPLPDVQANLEVRLLLLQRRLAERNSPVQIARTGRGMFRLQVSRPLLLDPGS